MKKELIAMAVILLAAITTLGAVYQLSIGRGGYFTASTSAQQINMITTNGSDGAQTTYAVCISVQNMGSNTIFAAHDCQNSSLFNKAVANNEAIPIHADEYFDFHGDKLASLWVATTNGTSLIKVGAY